MRLFLAVLVLSATPLMAFDDPAPATAPDPPGKIYECTAADGQVVYQDEPCIVAAPAPPVAKPQKSSKSTKTTKPTKVTKPPVRVITKPSPATIPWVARPSQLPTRRFDVPPASGPVDPRWATPEKTLQTFVGAVKSGDGTLVVSCLTSEALAQLGPDPAELPLEQLQVTVNSFTGFVPEGDVGPFWSIRALRAGMRPKWILFERTGSGEWKIGWI